MDILVALLTHFNGNTKDILYYNYLFVHCQIVTTMTSTPPPSNPFVIPPRPFLLSPSSSRHRGSIGSTFSFGPQHLVDSYLDAALDANSSKISNFNSALDPNRSVLQASPLRSSPRHHKKLALNILWTRTLTPILVKFQIQFGARSKPFNSL